MFGKFKEYKKGQCAQIVMTRGKVIGNRCDKNRPDHMPQRGLEFMLIAMRSNQGVASRRVA